MKTLPAGRRYAPKRTPAAPRPLETPEAPRIDPGAFPGASGTALDPFPQVYPAPGPTAPAFLYAELAKAAVPGSANTWTAPQTMRMPANTAAWNFTTIGVGVNALRVKNTYNGLWEVGTNSLLDGADGDFYWFDLVNNLLRMRVDQDGQLSLLGYTPTNNAVNNCFLLAAHVSGGFPTVGFGTGTIFRLPDAAGTMSYAGAINMVLTDVTPGAPSSRLDFYVQNGGPGSHPLTLQGSGGGGANGQVLLMGDLVHTGPKAGVYGATAVVQQTVTGSRGSGAALASLLTKLAVIGWIVDGSSA